MLMPRRRGVSVAAVISSPSSRLLLSEIRHWTLPGGGILAATSLWLYLDPSSPLLEEILSGYPLALYGVVALLAWRLRRSRVLAAVAGVAAVTLLPSMIAAPTATLALDLFQGAALPLAWLGLALLSDRPLFSRRGAGPVILVVCCLLGAVAAATLRPEALPELLDRPIAGSPPGLEWTLRPRILVPLLLTVPLLIVAIRRRGAVERGLVWSLFALEMALVFGPTDVRGGAFLMAGGFILGAAVVEGSHALAYRDELTDLPSRRALSHDLERLGPVYTVAMVDVDHFKRFNDRHGHDVGDQVLRMVAGRLRRGHGGGRAFRYGGEEFTILFPGMEPDEARPHAEEVRRSVADARFVLRKADRKRKDPGDRKEGGSTGGRKTLSVTISIGLAGPGDRGEAPEDVLNRADEALYRAKEKGRNRVEG